MTKASSPFLKEGMQKEKKKKKRRQGVGVPTERSKGKDRSWLLHRIAWEGGQANSNWQRRDGE